MTPKLTSIPNTPYLRAEEIHFSVGGDTYTFVPAFSEEDAVYIEATELKIGETEIFKMMFFLNEEGWLADSDEQYDEERDLYAIAEFFNEHNPLDV